jgi:hypothetical protein
MDKYRKRLDENKSSGYNKYMTEADGMIVFQVKKELQGA